MVSALDQSGLTKNGSVKEKYTCNPAQFVHHTGGSNLKWLGSFSGQSLVGDIFSDLQVLSKGVYFSVDMV